MVFAPEEASGKILSRTVRHLAQNLNPQVGALPDLEKLEDLL
jgi:hypothetical protein